MITANLHFKATKMIKKQYDDTELEYYGLTEEDLEKIKSEKTYTLEEIEKADIIQDMIEKLFWVKLTDTDFLLDLYNKLNLYVYNKINQTSWQKKKIVSL